MGRGSPPQKLRRTFSKNSKRTEQKALFGSSPAIIYHGTGKETTLDPAFVFNDNGIERVIKDAEARGISLYSRIRDSRWY